MTTPVHTLAETLAAHGGCTFDLSTPRQFTKDGGWNASCICGWRLCSHIGDCDCHARHQAAAIASLLSDEGLREKVEDQWGEFRDGPDYTPTDRYPVRDAFDAGWAAAFAVIRGALGVETP